MNQGVSEASSKMLVQINPACISRISGVSCAGKNRAKMIEELGCVVDGHFLYGDWDLNERKTLGNVKKDLEKWKRGEETIYKN